MAKIFMYQFAAERHGVGEVGELFYNEQLTIEEAKQLHNSEGDLTYLRFEEQEHFNHNLTTKSYSITYRAGNTLYGCIADSVMTVNSYTGSWVKDWVWASTGDTDVHILSIVPVGYGNKATAIDVKTMKPMEEGIRVGNVVNLVLNLLVSKPYGSITELIADGPKRQGYSRYHKQRAVQKSIKLGLILETPVGMEITDKGRKSLTILPPEDLIEPVTKPREERKMELSDNAKGILIVLSDGVVRRDLEAFCKECTTRGLSNHMKSIERSLSALVKKGFVTVDANGWVSISDNGLETAKTCTCERLDVDVVARLDVLTTEDIKTPIIFFKKALRMFKALPGNVYTEPGFVEFVRIELDKLGREVTTGRVTANLDKLRSQLDL